MRRLVIIHVALVAYVIIERLRIEQLRMKIRV